MLRKKGLIDKGGKLMRFLALARCEVRSGSSKVGQEWEEEITYNRFGGMVGRRGEVDEWVARALDYRE